MEVVQEQERFILQAHGHLGNQIARTDEPCLRGTHDPFCLDSGVPDPVIDESKAVAAVVILPVVDARGLSFNEHSAVLGAAVPYARNQLGQMHRCIGVMVDTEKEHLTVQLVDPSNRTLRDMGRQLEAILQDEGCLGTRRREGMRVTAPDHVRLPPKQLRHDTEIGGGLRRMRIEDVVVVIRPRRHDDRALGTHSVTKCGGEAERATLDRSDGPKRSMDEEDAAFPHAEPMKLLNERLATRGQHDEDHP